jgi:hypothetical protein
MGKVRGTLTATLYDHDDLKLLFIHDNNLNSFTTGPTILPIQVLLLSLFSLTLSCVSSESIFVDLVYHCLHSMSTSILADRYVPLR